ncbi:uncharacterized protein LOC115034650 isoform X1 [Acyrthosiphon pisum]|uniref:DUF4806 domain-containing protein n=1 Tax=Acyrthosiphon pisum TaxID=7029 RepID=A0A8R2NTS7_ACYPI|nr:uncharacterized protein LOC115034650 isoform X1 [Acyrthosiphon pisum]
MDQINKETKYIIGFFEPENKYSIIPINWLKKGKSNQLKCLWPDYRVTSMIIMKGAKPSSKWTTHTVKLISQFVSYQDAAAKELELFLTSEAESQSDNGEDLPNNNNDSTSSDDECIQILKKKKPNENHQLIPTYNTECVVECSVSSPSKTMYDMDANSVIDNNNMYHIPFTKSFTSNFDLSNIPAAVSNSTSMLNTRTELNTIDTTGTKSFASHFDLLNIPAELDNHGLDSGKMDQLLNVTNMFFTRIDKKLDIVIDYIKRNPNSNIQASSLDSTFLKYFPMNDLESLINMDALLKNDENISKLNNFINSIGGSDTKQYIKRVLPKLFSNKLATLCSWTGQKNNFRLVDHQIMKAMKKTSYELYKNDEHTFEQAVKDWFRHGAQRLKNEKMASDSSQKAQNN